MDDRGLAAAIVSGEPDGLAEALDRFGASLLASCRAALPADAFGADAAGEVVLDTFLIARLRLGALADPGELEAWLHAVARSECLRRARDAGVLPLTTIATAEAADSTFVSFPQRLRGQIMMSCTDDTPTGRASRAAVAHRAGPFGRDGFPNPAPVRRRRLTPGAATITAIGAAVVAAAVAVAVLGLHRAVPPRTAAAGVRTGGATTTAAIPGPPGDAPAAPVPRASRQTPGTPNPGAGATLQAATSPGQPPASAPAATPSAPPPPSSPKPSRSPVPPPAPPGTLVASTQFILLVSVNGKPASFTFTLTAKGGPVTGYTLYSPSATVQPADGSLPAGGSVLVTVTGRAKRSFTTRIQVSPGGLTIELRVVAKTVKTT